MNQIRQNLLLGTIAIITLAQCAQILLASEVSICTNAVMQFFMVIVILAAPQNITDFDCISYNHDRLVCNWTAPENYVKTNYSLTYTLEGRPSRLRQNTCPKIDADSNRMGCVWTVTTQPQYRQSHEVINFTLTATNVFGEFQYLRVFNHFEYGK